MGCCADWLREMRAAITGCALRASSGQVPANESGDAETNEMRCQHLGHIKTRATTCGAQLQLLAGITRIKQSTSAIPVSARFLLKQYTCTRAHICINRI